MSSPQAERRLREAACAFLSSLHDDAATSARMAFPSDGTRRDWTYLPGERRGLALADMNRSQAKAAHRLLAAGLSHHAYVQAATIMALEDVLDELQGGTKDRHSGDYWVTVFGEPGVGPWAWRFEGHHLSVNYTVGDDGELRPTPLFLGANPARFRADGASLVEPLAREERLAFALLDALSPAETSAAVVSNEAPKDIVSRDAAHVEGIEPQGLALADLGGEAATLAKALVSLYMGRLPPEVAGEQRTTISDDGLGAVRLAWAGECVAGGPHYYRLQGPTFFVELDNTQDGANHVHTVWRDPERDFGDDLLAAHHRTHHAPG